MHGRQIAQFQFGHTTAMLFGWQADRHFIVVEYLDDTVGDVRLVVVAIAGCKECNPPRGSVLALAASFSEPKLSCGLQISTASCLRAVLR